MNLPFSNTLSDSHMQQDHLRSSPSKILRQPTPDAMHQYKIENVVEGQPHHAKSYLEIHRCTLLRPADSARCNLFMFPYKAKDVRLLRKKIQTSNTLPEKLGP